MIAFLGGLLSRDTRLNLQELRATIDQLATANRNLARSETKYRSFVELAVDAIFVVDRDGVILEVNRQASVLSGVAREQLLGASMKNVISAARARENPLPLDVLAQCVPIMRPCRISRPDGTVAEAEIHSAMLPEGWGFTRAISAMATLSLPGSGHFRFISTILLSAASGRHDPCTIAGRSTSSGLHFAFNCRREFLVP